MLPLSRPIASSGRKRRSSSLKASSMTGLRTWINEAHDRYLYRQPVEFGEADEKRRVHDFERNALRDNDDAGE